MSIVTTTNFPTSLDAATTYNADDKVATIDHAGMHSGIELAVIAAQTKIGIGSSTPDVNKVFRGTAAGASEWAALQITDIESTDLSGADGTLITGTIAAADKILVTNSDNDAVEATIETDTPIDVSSGVIHIDGDKLDIDFTPTNYTPDATPSEVDDVNDLSAHLKGIDTSIGSSSGTSALTLLPKTVAPINTNSDPGTAVTLDTNTEAFVGQINIPHKITVNKITVRTATTITTAGTIDLTLYAEDGQSQIFSVTTASLSAANTLYSTAVSAVEVPAGIYYLMANTNSTTNVQVYFWNTDGDPPFGGTEGFLEDVSSEPVVQGTATITAGTPPATFDPTTDITGSTNAVVITRLDN